MASDETIDLSDAGKPNCCQTVVQYNKCYLVWLVKNFSYCRQPTGEALSSCIFSSEEADSLKFRLDLYPRGTSDSQKDIVAAIRLITDKDAITALVQYDCFLVGKDQKAYYREQDECLLAPGRNSHPMMLVNREDLISKKDVLLVEDALYLACALRYSFREETGISKFKIKSQL